jgi:octaprenyl-diphosphate synthase
LREGKPTLPLIYLMKNGTAEEKELVRTCIEQGDESQFDKILHAITQSGALNYTKEKAAEARCERIQKHDTQPCGHA